MSSVNKTPLTWHRDELTAQAVAGHEAAPAHAFRGAHAECRCPAAAEEVVIFLLNEVDLGIAAIGIVVKHHQAPDLGI